MKANKIVRSRLRVVMIVAVVVSLLQIIIYGVQRSYDSESYLVAWNRFGAGIPDIDRTPVYPAFLQICRSVAGESHMQLLAIIVQNIVSWVAIWCFYRIAVRVTRSKKATFWSSLAVAVIPAFTMWHSYILTESLSVSFSIFLFYCLLNIYNRKSWWGVAGAFVWTFLLLFLRPAFLYLLPVLFVAFIIMIWQKKDARKQAVVGILGLFIIAGTLVSYMKAFEKQYGVFAITRVSTYNNYFIMRQNGTLDPEKTDNMKLRAFLENSYKKYGRGPNTVNFDVLGRETSNVVIDDFDLSSVTKLENESRKAHIGDEFIGVLRHTYNGGKELLLDAGGNTPFDIFNVSLGWVYLILLFYIIAIYADYRKKGTLDWANFLMLMMGVSNIIVAVVGAMTEFSRLVVPSKFIYLLMLAQLCCIFANKRRENAIK